jgi:hypothetical protein
MTVIAQSHGKLQDKERSVRLALARRVLARSSQRVFEAHNYSRTDSGQSYVFTSLRLTRGLVPVSAERQTQAGEQEANSEMPAYSTEVYLARKTFHQD